MSRVLVLIGAFLFFRIVLPRNSRSSSTAISPYMNALDGALSAQQVSSVLDEVMPHESWLAVRRANIGGKAQGTPLKPDLTVSAKGPVTGVQSGAAKNTRP